MSIVENDYEFLKGIGEVNDSVLVASISSLRKRAKKDGYAIQTSTTTDANRRKTRLVALVNPKTMTIVGRG
jgi:hypothetical protein